jgi:hypothetical protein
MINNNDTGIKISNEVSVDKRENGVIQHLPGKINDTIGSGSYAQATIAWLTIKWSFISGCVLTFFCLILAIASSDYNGSIGNITSVWTIFAPIITLVLGYMFGKGKE